MYGFSTCIMFLEKSFVHKTYSILFETYIHKIVTKELAEGRRRRWSKDSYQPLMNLLVLFHVYCVHIIQSSSNNYCTYTYSSFHPQSHLTGPCIVAYMDVSALFQCKLEQFNVNILYYIAHHYLGSVLKIIC